MTGKHRTQPRGDRQGDGRHRGRRGDVRRRGGLRCDTVRALLDDLAADDLAADDLAADARAGGGVPDRGALRGHLLDCMDCRRAFRSAVDAQRALRAAVHGARDELLHSRGVGWFAALEAEVVARAAAAGPPPRRRARAWPWRRAAAAAVLFLVGLAYSGTAWHDDRELDSTRAEPAWDLPEVPGAGAAVAREWAPPPSSGGLTYPVSVRREPLRREVHTGLGAQRDADDFLAEQLRAGRDAAADDERAPGLWEPVIRRRRR